MRYNPIEVLWKIEVQFVEVKVLEHRIPKQDQRTIALESLGAARAEYLYDRWKTWAAVILDLQSVIENTSDNSTPAKVSATLKDCENRSLRRLKVSKGAPPTDDPLSMENCEFAEQVVQIVEHLKKVHNKVYKFRNSYDLLSDALEEEELRFNPLGPTQFTPFSVIFTVSSSDMKRLAEAGSVGCHIEETPFIFIDHQYHKHHPEQRALTIRHELGHLILDVLNGDLDLDPEAELFPALKKLEKGRISTQKFTSIFNRLNPLSMQREELLVELACNPTTEILKRNYILIAPNNSDWYWTAGVEINSLSGGLERVAAKRRRDNLSTIIQADFTKFSVRFSRALHVAQSIGDDAVKEILALATVILPDHYNHLMGYLRHRYGDRCDTSAALKLRVVGPQLITLPDLKAICHLGRLFLPQDYELVRGAVDKSLKLASDKKLPPLSFYGIRTRAELREYQACVSRLAQKVPGLLELSSYIRKKFKVRNTHSIVPKVTKSTGF